MIESITDLKTVSLHHDISTVTGEEVILFTLVETPKLRELTKKEHSTKRPPAPV